MLIVSCLYPKMPCELVVFLHLSVPADLSGECWIHFCYDGVREGQTLGRGKDEEYVRIQQMRYLSKQSRVPFVERRWLLEAPSPIRVMQRWHWRIPTLSAIRLSSLTVIYFSFRYATIQIIRVCYQQHDYRERNRRGRNQFVRERLRRIDKRGILCFSCTS